MRNNMQTRQGEVGHARHAGPIGLSGSKRQQAYRTRNISGATSGRRKTASIELLESRVHYREDNVLGIAWCDVVFK
jgi:hypothetical protein